MMPLPAGPVATRRWLHQLLVRSPRGDRHRRINDFGWGLAGMDRGLQRAMRIRSLLTVAVMSLPLFAAACADDSDLPTNEDGDAPLSEDNVNEGAPDNDSLPDDNK